MARKIVSDLLPLPAETEYLLDVLTTRRAAGREVSLERLRAGFLAMVSHELRTPLTSIIGSATDPSGDNSGLHPTEMRRTGRIPLSEAVFGIRGRTYKSPLRGKFRNRSVLCS